VLLRCAGFGAGLDVPADGVELAGDVDLAVVAALAGERLAGGPAAVCGWGDVGLDVVFPEPARGVEKPGAFVSPAGDGVGGGSAGVESGDPGLVEVEDLELPLDLGVVVVGDHFPVALPAGGLHLQDADEQLLAGAVGGFVDEGVGGAAR